MASPPKSPVSLGRDDEKAAEESAPPPGPLGITPPPNGGTRAWLQVFGAFGVFFNTWGLLNTFGVFQTYYETGELFVESSSNISWVGSVQAFLVLVGGLISGPLYDRGFLRFQVGVGSFLVVFGQMMLSLATRYWEVVLAQGFCIGLGAGLMFTPSVTVLQSYFSTKIGLATGIAASGSSLGGIIYPIVLYRLIDEIGFPWSVRVIGFICLATLIPPVLLLRQRVKPPRVRAMFDTTAFTDGGWLLFTFGCLLGFAGLYVMLFYLSYYGLATGTTDASMAFYIVPILNAASMFGRTLPNWLSDRTGPFNVLIPSAFICGVLVLCMQAVHSLAVSIDNSCFQNQWRVALWELTYVFPGVHPDCHLLWLFLRSFHCASHGGVHRPYTGQVQNRNKNRHGLRATQPRYARRWPRRWCDPGP